MCQNEDSQKRSLSHDLAEFSPLLAPSETSVNIDVSYHSFPSPAWTKGFPQLLIKHKYDEPASCAFRKMNTAPWAIVLFGQSLAAALAIGNFEISSLDSTYDIRMPALTMGVVYLVLSLHLVFISFKQYQKKGSSQTYNSVETGQQNYALNADCDELYFFPFTKLTLQTPWQAYLLLAILDLEANYLTMLSFQHTSVSSSMLLTSLSVFSTLLFRRCVFGRASVTYSGKKIIGVFISVVGACLWIRKDFYESNHSAYSTGRNAIYGDLLAISSALLYGLNDVLLEYTVKSNNDRLEYLGMIGLFGFLLSFFVQAPIFESREITKLLQNFPVVNFADGSGFVLCGFIVMMSYFYISVTVFLSVNDATILNLSLQSSPLWAVILTSLVDIGGETASWEFPPVVFFVALAMVVCGMFLYEATPVKNQ